MIGWVKTWDANAFGVRCERRDEETGGTGFRVKEFAVSTGKICARHGVQGRRYIGTATGEADLSVQENRNENRRSDLGETLP